MVFFPPKLDIFFLGGRVRGFSLPFLGGGFPIWGFFTIFLGGFFCFGEGGSPRLWCLPRKPPQFVPSYQPPPIFFTPPPNTLYQLYQKNPAPFFPPKGPICTFSPQEKAFRFGFFWSCLGFFWHHFWGGGFPVRTGAFFWRDFFFFGKHLPHLRHRTFTIWSNRTQWGRTARKLLPIQTRFICFSACCARRQWYFHMSARLPNLVHLLSRDRGNFHTF